MSIDGSQAMSLEGGLAGREEAEFFKTPELVERMLLSTKQLAKSSDLTRKVLRKASTWEKMIKRIFPEDQSPANSRLEDGNLASERIKARLLAEILTIILNDSEPWREELPKDVKVPPVFHLGFLPLLHTICESFPSKQSPLHRNANPSYSDHINVRCSCVCGMTHRVSPFGFILLEEVEATLNQKDMAMDLVVDEVRIQDSTLEGPLLTALASMVGRQCWPVKELDVQDFGCANKESADAVAALMEKSQAMPSNESWIFIYEDIGTEGWSAVRRAAETLARRFGKEVKLDSDRKAMGGGRKEDLKAIWNNASEWGVQTGGKESYGLTSDISYSKSVYGKKRGWEGVKGQLLKPLVSRWIHFNFEFIELRQQDCVHFTAGHWLTVKGSGWQP